MKRLLKHQQPFLFNLKFFPHFAVIKASHKLI